jgi:hypothetical protein
VRRRRRNAGEQVGHEPRARPARFVRLIEFQTTRIDEVCALERQWREAEGTGSATAMTITRDRDRQNRYVWMIEFPSREHAARSDELDETRDIAEQLMKLADGPAVFRNLDALDDRP